MNDLTHRRQNEQAIQRRSAVDDLIDADASNPAAFAECERWKQQIKRRTAEALQEIEWAQMRHIERHGDITLGTVRHYVGLPAKPAKVINPITAYRAAMRKLDGDEDALLNLLTTQPFKVGALRQVLGDEAAKHIEQPEPEPKLLEGKAKAEKKLLSVNTAFTK